MHGETTEQLNWSMGYMAPVRVLFSLQTLLWVVDLMCLYSLLDEVCGCVCSNIMETNISDMFLTSNNCSKLWSGSINE